MKNLKVARVRKLLSLPLALLGIVLFAGASFITPGLASITSPFSVATDPQLVSPEARYEYDNSTVEGRLLNLQGWIRALKSYSPAAASRRGGSRLAHDLPKWTGLSLADFDSDGRWIDRRKAPANGAYPYMTQPDLTAKQRDWILNNLNDNWFRSRIAAAIRIDSNLGGRIAAEIANRARSFAIGDRSASGFDHLKNLFEFLVKPENIDILETVYEGTGAAAKNVSSLFDVPAGVNGSRINPFDLYEALATGDKDYFLKRTKAELEVIKGIVPTSRTNKGTLYEKVALIVGKRLEQLRIKAGPTGDRWNVGWYITHVIPREAIKRQVGLLREVNAILRFGNRNDTVAYTDADFDDFRNLYTSHTPEDPSTIKPGFAHELVGEDGAKSVANLFEFFEDSSWKVLDHITEKITAPSSENLNLARIIAKNILLFFRNYRASFWNGHERVNDTVKELLADEWMNESDREEIAAFFAPFEINKDLFDPRTGLPRTTPRNPESGESAYSIATPYKTGFAANENLTATRNNSWYKAVFATDGQEETSDYNVFNKNSKFLKGENAAEKLESFGRLFSFLSPQTIEEALEDDFRAAANRLELILPYLQQILTTSAATVEENKDQLAVADNGFSSEDAGNYFEGTGISASTNGNIDPETGTLTGKTAENTIFGVLSDPTSTSPFRGLTLANLRAIAALSLPNPKLKKPTSGADKVGRIEYLEQEDSTNSSQAPDWSGVTSMTRPTAAGVDQWHNDLFKLRSSNSGNNAAKKRALLLALKELRASSELRKTAGVLKEDGYSEADDAIYFPLIELYIEYLEASSRPVSNDDLPGIFAENAASETPNSLVTAIENGLFTDDANEPTTESNYEKHLLAAFLLQLTRAQLEVFTNTGDNVNLKNWASLETGNAEDTANPFLEEGIEESVGILGSDNSTIISKIKEQYEEAQTGYDIAKINRVFRPGLVRLFKLYPELLEANGLDIEADYGIDLDWWQPDEGTTDEFSQLNNEFEPKFTDREETKFREALIVDTATHFTYGKNTINQYLRLKAKNTAFSEEGAGLAAMKKFLEDSVVAAEGSGLKKISDILDYGSSTNGSETKLYSDEAEENLLADPEIRRWLSLIQATIAIAKEDEALEVQLFGDESLSEEEAAAQGFLPRSWLNKDWSHTVTTGEEDNLTTTATPWFKPDGSINTDAGAKRTVSTQAADDPFIGTPESTHPALFDLIPLAFVRAWTAPATAVTTAEAAADRAFARTVRNRMLANFRSSNILATARAAYIQAAKRAIELQPYLVAFQKFATAQKDTPANQSIFTETLAPLNALSTEKDSNSDLLFTENSVEIATLKTNIANASNPDFFLESTDQPKLLGALDTVTEWNALAALTAKDLAKALLANTAAKAKIEAIVAMFFGAERANIVFLAERLFLFDQLYKESGSMTTLRKRWAEEGIIFTPDELYSENEDDFTNDYADQSEFFTDESGAMKLKYDLSDAPEESVWWKLFAMDYSAADPTIPGTTDDDREKLFKGLLKGDTGSFNGPGEVLFANETVGSRTTSIFQLALNYAFNQFNATSQARMRENVAELIKGFEKVFPQLKGLLFDATGTSHSEGANTTPTTGIGIALKADATENDHRLFEIEFTTPTEGTVPGKFGWLTVTRKGVTFMAADSTFWIAEKFAVRFGFVWDSQNNKVKAALADIRGVKWDKLEALANLPNQLPLDQKHMDPILTQISAEAARAGNEATSAAARTIWGDTDTINLLPVSMREVVSQKHNRFTYETGVPQRVEGKINSNENEIRGWNIYRNDGYKTPITAPDLTLLIDYDSSQTYEATSRNVGVRLVGNYFKAIGDELSEINELSTKPESSTHSLDGVANGLSRMRSDPTFREFIQDRFFADPSETLLPNAIETPTLSGNGIATNDPLVFADFEFATPTADDADEAKENYNAIVTANSPTIAPISIKKFPGFRTLDVPAISYSAASGIKRALAFMAKKKRATPTQVRAENIRTLQDMEVFWEESVVKMLKNGIWSPNRTAAASVKDTLSVDAFVPNTRTKSNDNARDFAAYALPRLYPALDYETIALLARQVNAAGTNPEWKTSGANKVSDNINFERIPSLQRMRDLALANGVMKRLMDETRNLVELRNQMLDDAIAADEKSSSVSNSVVSNSETPFTRTVFDYRFREAVFLSEQEQKIEKMIQKIEAELSRNETRSKIVRIQNGEQKDDGLLFSLGLDANKDFDANGAIKSSSLSTLKNSLRNSNIERIRSINNLIQNDAIFDPALRASIEAGNSHQKRTIAIVSGSLVGLLVLVIVATLIWKKKFSTKSSSRRR